MLKLYVEFLFPGNVVSDISEKEVQTRKESIKLPKGSYGYRFFEREETGNGDDIKYGIKKNHSSVIYYGTEITLAQLKKEMPGEHALISMMEKNGYKRVVKTQFGQFIPLANSDSVKNIPKK
jgi:hypothetical protein